MVSQFKEKDWNEYAQCYDILNSLIPYRQMLEDAVRELRREDGTILDAGCGTGNLIAHISSDFWKDVIGVDSSMAMLKRARLKCPAVPLACANLNTGLPFRGQMFAAIVCVNTLYAVEQPERVLREFFRLLRPRGKLVLITPKLGYENGLILKAHCRSERSDRFWKNVHATREREAYLIREAFGTTEDAERLRKLGEFNRSIAKERRFRFFTPSELKKKVQEACFEHIQLTTTYAHQNLFLVAQRREKGTNDADRHRTTRAGYIQ